MKKINLKDYYAHISIDTYIEIPDEVFDIFEEHRKAEHAYQSKRHYYKAYYSLNGITKDPQSSRQLYQRICGLWKQRRYDTT